MAGKGTRTINVVTSSRRVDSPASAIARTFPVRLTSSPNYRIDHVGWMKIFSGHADKCVKALKILPFLIILIPGDAVSHPRCDVARKYSVLKSMYSHVITGRASIADIEQQGGIHTGHIRIAHPRYVKWPRSDGRSPEIIAQFSYDPAVECDWYPNVRHKKFVLEKVGDHFVVVSSFRR